MSLKEVAEKFSMTKKELDQAYFAEMRSVLNAIEVELQQARNDKKELLEASKRMFAYEYGFAGESQIDNIEEMPAPVKKLYKAIKKAEGDN